jgi:ABC-type Fe3+ transport system permease subunit
MDNAWLQGFSTALGTSALFRLQSEFQSLGEVLDRKAAYALAAFSLYVAILSMALTVVFGYLSLK